MPAEAAHVPSPYHEPRRPVLQRQTSITQTIRRYCPCHSPGLGLVLGMEAGTQGPPGYWGWDGARALSFLLHLDPHIPHPPRVLGTACSHPLLSLLPWHSLSSASHPNALAPHSRQVRFGRVHTLPLLGPRAACRAPPQRQSLSWSLLRYHRQVPSVLLFPGMCMLCGLLEAARVVGIPCGSSWQVLAVFLFACPRTVGGLPGSVACCPSSLLPWVVAAAFSGFMGWVRTKVEQPHWVMPAEVL